MGKTPADLRAVGLAAVRGEPLLWTALESAEEAAELPAAEEAARPNSAGQAAAAEAERPNSERHSAPALPTRAD